MNIMENKRVTLLSVLFAAGFGFLVYYGYQQYRQMIAIQQEISDTRVKVEGYADEELPPTRENSQFLEKAAGTVDQHAAALRSKVQEYAKACRSQGTDISPSRFQKDVNDMTAKIASYASGKRCTLSPDAAALGLNEYKTASATDRDAPYLNFLLHAADNVVRKIVDAGAPDVKRFYCAPLPEEQVAARKPAPYFPLEMEVSFSARRSQTDIDPGKEDTLSVLPKVINSIINDGKYFYIITGVSVKTPETLPMLTSYKSAAAPTGDSLVPTNEAAAPADTPVAQQITGKADSRVVVSLSLQVLYFTTDKL